MSISKVVRRHTYISLCSFLCLLKTYSVIFLQGVDFWAINTDSQALIQSAATHRIQIGEELTRGLGEVHNWTIVICRKSAKRKRFSIQKITLLITLYIDIRRAIWLPDSMLTNFIKVRCKEMYDPCAISMYNCCWKWVPIWCIANNLYWLEAVRTSTLVNYAHAVVDYELSKQEYASNWFRNHISCENHDLLELSFNSTWLLVRSWLFFIQPFRVW